jgi:hypothetical protein
MTTIEDKHAIIIVKGKRLIESNVESEIIQGISEIQNLLYSAAICITPVLESGIPSDLVKFLTSKNDRMVSSSAKCLASLSIGTVEQTKLLLDLDIISICFGLIDQSSETVFCDIVWLMGQIMDNSETVRGIIHDLGISKVISKRLENSLSNTSYAMISWFIDVFCSKLVSFDQMRGFVQPILKLLIIKKEDVLDGALTALNSISMNRKSEEIQFLIDSGCLIVLQKVIEENIKSTKHKIVWIAQRVLGNFTSGNSVDHLEAVLKIGYPKFFPYLCVHNDVDIRRDCFLILSNMTAIGTTDQIQQLITSSVLSTGLRELESEQDQKVLRWAVEAYSAAIGRGTTEQIQILCKEGCLELFGKGLQLDSTEAVLRCLQMFWILNSRDKKGEILKNINELGKSKINELQGHSDPKISQYAKALHSLFK